MPWSGCEIVRQVAKYASGVRWRREVVVGVAVETVTKSMENHWKNDAIGGGTGTRELKQEALGGHVKLCDR